MNIPSFDEDPILLTVSVDRSVIRMIRITGLSLFLGGGLAYGLVLIFHILPDFSVLVWLKSVIERNAILAWLIMSASVFWSYFQEVKKAHDILVTREGFHFWQGVGHHFIRWDEVTSAESDYSRYELLALNVNCQDEAHRISLNGFKAPRTLLKAFSLNLGKRFTDPCPSPWLREDLNSKD